MRGTIHLALTLVLLVASATNSLGQETPAEVCRPALMKDTLSIMSTEQQKYSYFSQIDQRTYEQLKRDINAGVSIPLVGDMLNVVSGSTSNELAETNSGDDFRAERVGDLLFGELRLLHGLSSGADRPKP